MKKIVILILMGFCALLKAQEVYYIKDNGQLFVIKDNNNSYNISDTRKSLMILSGLESNSGGNPAIPELEKIEYTRLKTLNTITYNVENMHIGTNTNLDHANITPNSQVGWQIGLAKIVEADTIFKKYKTICFVELGQGGSVIGEWAPGYLSGYLEKAFRRIDSASSKLGGNVDVYIVYTMGINDEIHGTDSALYRTRTENFIDTLKSRTNFIKIAITNNPSILANDTINYEISLSRSDAIWVDTTSQSTLNNQYHWDIPGYTETIKNCINAFINQ